MTDVRDLRADCSRCTGLCCVAPAFAASADFALDKPAGQPCPNLHRDSSCGIHADLRQRGFPGCAVFDCFGAGQQVVQVTFAGRSWREDPVLAAAMFAVFPVMRQLHELRWYLAEALARLPSGALRDEVADLQAQTEGLASAGADQLVGLDAGAHRARVGPLLEQVSLVVRGAAGVRGRDHRGADLMGADLRGADLRGATLRGAYLIGAHLQGADLREADLLGADLRAADLRGVRLHSSIFLTQPQLDAAAGDASTTLPPAVRRPLHW